MEKAFLCYCGAPMVQRESQWGKFWGCSEYPRCEGTVGAHQRTGEPLGIAADKVTRGLRKECHDLFDAFWLKAAAEELEAAEMEGFTADEPEGVEYVVAEFRRKWRSLAYRWMRSRMGIFELGKELHIAELDHEGCRKFLMMIGKVTMDDLLAFEEWEIEDQFESTKHAHLRQLGDDVRSVFDED